MALERVGIDTTFLVAHTLLEHPDHRRALVWKEKLLEQGSALSVCETVIWEFIHVVTDSRRFKKPVAIEEAIKTARTWLYSRESATAFPTTESIALTVDWLDRFRLGRKRILDTAIAATYHSSGIKTILTGNVRDFHVFGCFKVIDISEDEPAAEKTEG